MASESVREAIRGAVKAIENVGPGATVDAAYERVKAAMDAHGLVSGCHASEGGNPNLTDEQTVEWYAGQFMDIVEHKSWFAMNSFVNCLDKFVPEVPRGE